MSNKYNTNKPATEWYGTSFINSLHKMPNHCKVQRLTGLMVTALDLQLRDCGINAHLLLGKDWANCSQLWHGHHII